MWSFSTGAVNGHEAAPIVHDGVMFVATPGSQVIAIEAATGTVLWRYRRPLGPTVINRHPTTRGVGLLGDKVFLAASDAVLMALDARTGRTVWSTTVADNRGGHYMSLAPLVANGKVLIGTSAASSVSAGSSPPSTLTPARSCGAPTQFRRRVSPAARRGQKAASSGRPAAARCG